jgi:hypothetical protein
MDILKNKSCEFIERDFNEIICELEDVNKEIRRIKNIESVRACNAKKKQTIE